MRAKRLRDAGPEFVRLDEHGHERLDVVDLRPRGKILEGLHAGLAGADFGRDHAQFLSERGIGEAEFLGRLDDRLVETAARLDAHDEQVERIRKAVADLLFAPVDSSREEELRQHIAEHRRHQRQHPTAAVRATDDDDRDCQEHRHEDRRESVHGDGGWRQVSGHREPAPKTIHVFRRFWYAGKPPELRVDRIDQPQATLERLRGSQRADLTKTAPFRRDR